MAALGALMRDLKVELGNTDLGVSSRSPVDVRLSYHGLHGNNDNDPKRQKRTCTDVPYHLIDLRHLSQQLTEHELVVAKEAI